MSGRFERDTDISAILYHFGLEGRERYIFPELTSKSALKLVKRLDIVEALIKGQVRVCGLIPFDEIAGLVSYSLRNVHGKEWRNLYSDNERLEVEISRLIARRYGLVRIDLEGRGNAVCREDIIEPLKVSYAQEISRVDGYKRLTADELLDPESQMDSDELMKLQGILELLGTYASEAEISKLKEELVLARDKVASGHGELDVLRGLAEMVPFPGSDELVTFIGATTRWCGSIRRWELKGHTRDEIEDRITDSGD